MKNYSTTRGITELHGAEWIQLHHLGDYWWPTGYEGAFSVYLMQNGAWIYQGEISAKWGTNKSLYEAAMRFLRLNNRLSSCAN